MESSVFDALWKSVVWAIAGGLSNFLAIIMLNLIYDRPILERNDRFFNFSTNEDMIFSAAAIFAWPMVLAMLWAISLMELWESVKRLIRAYKE